jgi:putative transposase
MAIARKKGHTEEQIIAALQQAEAGAKTGELCRKARHQSSHILQLKRQYAGLGEQELGELLC